MADSEWAWLGPQADGPARSAERVVLAFGRLLVSRRHLRASGAHWEEVATAAREVPVDSWKRGVARFRRGLRKREGVKLAKGFEKGRGRALPDALRTFETVTERLQALCGVRA